MKNNITKIIALFTTFAMVLSLAACGGSPAPEQTQIGELAPAPSSDIPAYDSGLAFPFAFAGKDVYGNQITEADLSGKDIWFVHLWGTWCGPCVREMPDIGELVNTYKDRVGFLALLDDFDDVTTISSAQKMYESYGMADSFITVDAWSTFAGDHALMTMLLTGYVPTTVLIDADGNMLEQLIGAYGVGYGEIIDKHLP